MQREKFSVKIADIVFETDTYFDPYTKDIFKPYLTTEDDLCNDKVKVHCSRIQGDIEEPLSNKLTEREDYNWYSDGNGKYTMCFIDPDEGFVCARFDYDDNLKTAEVVLKDVRAYNGTDDEFFLSNILERLFRLVIVFCGGFIVHASSIVHEGYGLAFSALSGTGKSTHTDLWQKVYPGTYILNDDGPALRQIGDIWYIYGTPWAGTSGINKNEKAPLKALVFLERNEYNVIRDISAIEGLRRIFEAIIHPVSDELMSRILSSVSSFMSLARLCVLGCNISEEAPKTVKEFLYNQED